MKFLGIQNCELEGFGLYETLLRHMGVEFDNFPAYQGSPLPSPTGYEAILIGGTPVSAYAIKDHPFLVAQEQYLRLAIGQGKPCLGICFGAQLLAKVLGGKVGRARKKEIGVSELKLTAAGKTETLLQGFPAQFPAFQWHGDTFDLPPKARLLVKGADCRNQMFRRDKTVGLQFHLEVTTGEVSSWARTYAPELQGLGKSAGEMLSEVRAQGREIWRLARLFVKNFVSWIKDQGAA